jgi:hypothetical protein
MKENMVASLRAATIDRDQSYTYILSIAVVHHRGCVHRVKRDWVIECSISSYPAVAHNVVIGITDFSVQLD